MQLQVNTKTPRIQQTYSKQAQSKIENQNPISKNHVMHAGEFEITKIERKWCVELIRERKKVRHRERGQVSTLQVN